MNLSECLRVILFILVTLFASVSDLLHHKIPNLAIFLGASAGAVLNVIFSVRADGQSLFYSISFIIILIFLFSKGLIGGGDVKLYAVLVLIYPNRISELIIFYSMLFAGVFAVFKLIYACHGKEFLSLFLKKYPMCKDIKKSSLYGTKDSLPLAPFIFLAYVFLLVFKGELLWTR